MNIFKQKSEFSKNILTLVSGTSLAQAFPLFMSPILARIYSPQDFGVFALFIALVGFLSVMSTGRYSEAIVLPRKDKYAINIFALSMLFLFLTFAVSELLIILFDSIFTDTFRNTLISEWLYLVPLNTTFVAFFILLTNYNNRQKNYKDIAVATILKSFILVVVQSFLGYFKFGVYGLISGQIVSQFFANIKLLQNIIKNKILLKEIKKLKILAVMRKYNNFPKYNLPHALFGNLSSNLPVYIFTPFFGSIIVGYYSFSLMVIFTPLMVLAASTARVYNQKISEMNNKKEDTYTFTIKILKSLSKKIIIPFIGLTLFAPYIFEIIFGQDWIEAGIYTQILSPYLILNILVSTIAFIPNLLGMQKKAFLVALVHFLMLITVLYYFSNNYDIYMSLAALSLINSSVLVYNLSWMLRALKVRR